MKCMWYSSDPAIIVQVTSLYDFAFDFCSWCFGVRGLGLNTLAELAVEMGRLVGATKAFVVGGETLLRKNLQVILKELGNAGFRTIVFTKGSLPQLCDRIINGEPSEVYAVVPTLNSKGYMKASGGRSIKLPLESVKKMLNAGVKARVLTMDPGEDIIIDVPLRFALIGPSPECASCRTVMLTCMGELTLCPVLRTVRSIRVTRSVKHRLREALREIMSLRGDVDVRGRIRVEVLVNDVVIDSTVLSALHALRETGSFLKASRLLGIPVNTIRGKIRKVEDKLGLKLVEAYRGGDKRGGARLTPLANRVLSEATRLRARAMRTLNLIVSCPEESRGMHGGGS